MVATKLSSEDEESEKATMLAVRLEAEVEAGLAGLAVDLHTGAKWPDLPHLLQRLP